MYILVKEIGFKQKGGSMSNFESSDYQLIYGAVYNPDSQESLVESETGLKIYIAPDHERFFVPGQLAPQGDFFFTSWQVATQDR